ncbi:hypothetical protein [Flavimarina sp. Hel_I_48]|uniref:hypothetical protein n=1 Tax=Flavimarina sp. Hel_I_48 TaxID=1392488 RepID=UPI0004DFABBD|nr:hypothetical protein [Flavimarina sp. Hel_I_48]
MDFQSRKIKFIQEFLDIHSEDTLSKLEKLLKKQRKLAENGNFQRMTEEELNRRIDQSEADFKAGKYKQHLEIAAKYNDHI